ncbi:sigma 54-interacting transcriptional regulator [bacterium]|nr:sigma 54-interacting transcriptional regulator [bacterium]
MQHTNYSIKHSPITSGLILDSVSDGIFTVDNELKITSFNHGAEKTTGISRDKALGKHCWDVFKSNKCNSGCVVKKSLSEGKSFNDSFISILSHCEEKIPIDISTTSLKTKSKEIIGCIGVFRDLRLVEKIGDNLKTCYRVGDMISKSPTMKKIFDIVPYVAESSSTVLIEGETGTGKELLARAIHDLGPRKDKPFVAINCGALPDTLLESELFGYKAGAFTDAVKDKPGHFTVAKGGTVFLDEIGETSPAFQVRLLRVLQEKQIVPLGGIKSIPVDVRVIVATNQDLYEAVKQEEFRKDLYYRIDVMEFKLPALRERKEDIPLLIEYFVDRKNKSGENKIKLISRNTLPYFMAYNYPGNVRELENIIEKIYIFCGNGVIKYDYLPDVLKNVMIDKSSRESCDQHAESPRHKIILEALANNNNNYAAAARELGIHKSTLYRKLKKLGLKS